MNNSQLNRRRFIKAAAITTAGLVINPAISKKSLASSSIESKNIGIEANHLFNAEPRIRFSVININHAHIYSMAAAVIRGGGKMISFYAKEPDLAAAFSKQFPDVKQVTNEKEILEDTTIQLVLSSGIPDQRAPLGIEVMRHGKDYLVDKPGIITLEQLAAVRKVQKETKQIYSIMYSERFENRATVKAGELVKAGAIGKVIQTIGLGPHRINNTSRPDWFFDRKRYGGASGENAARASTACRTSSSQSISSGAKVTSPASSASAALNGPTCARISSTFFASSRNRVCRRVSPLLISSGPPFIGDRAMTFSSLSS